MLGEKKETEKTKKEIWIKAKLDGKEIRKIVALINKSLSWFFENLTKQTNH